jgi:arginase
MPAARKVTFIGVPLDLGAGRRGVDMGPSALRGAEIHARVRELGIEVADHGDMEVSIAETRDPGDPKLKYLNEIRQTCAALRDVVALVLAEGRMPIVLGGDHSIAMGTIAGASQFHRERNKKKIGLIWFDAHGDMNTPDTSPTGNIHGMPLAVALGLGEKSLVDLAGERPMGCATWTWPSAPTSRKRGSAPSPCGTSTSAGCARSWKRRSSARRPAPPAST